MKYIFVIILLVFAAVYYFQKITPIEIKQPDIQITPSVSTLRPDYEVTIGKYIFVVYWQQIDAADLRLLPNFDQKQTSSEIMEKEQCSYGANGGFYTQDNKPIGLFIADVKKISSAVTNATFNGFFVKDQNTVYIQRSLPNPNIDFALQSGPFMTPKTNVRIQRDELARRILVGRSSDDKWYFIAVTEKDNSFSGPLLTQVPEILGKLPIRISEALNLDGGSASAFYSEDGVRLGELTPVGSFFCGKD